MNNLIWLLLLLGFSTHIQAEDKAMPSQDDKKGSKLLSTIVFPVVMNKTETNTISPKVLEYSQNGTEGGTDRVDKIESTLEEKVQKRGLGLIDLRYGFGDKFDHAYYLGQDFPVLPPVSINPTDLPAPSQAPPVHTFPPVCFPTATTPIENYFLPPSTAPFDFFLTTSTPATTILPPPSLAPINLGHSTHIEKAITFYQGIPQPYPVIKHFPVPVEKQVPVEVKVPVSVPVAIEKTVHVPVKIPVTIPVVVPQPYPVVKEIRVPVKVFVDKPYPVYVQQHVDAPEPPVSPPDTPELPNYHFEQHTSYVDWKLPEKPLEEVYNPPEDDSTHTWTEEPLDPLLDYHHYDLSHHNRPSFVTSEKPEYEYEKIYSASNKVENKNNVRTSHHEDAKRPTNNLQPNDHKYLSRGVNHHNPEHSRPNNYHHESSNDKGQNKPNHRDVDDHRHHGRRDQNDRQHNPHNYRKLDRYQSQRNNHRDYPNRRRNQNYQNYQDQREHRQAFSESRHSDELVLHTNFK